MWSQDEAIGRIIKTRMATFLSLYQKLVICNIHQQTAYEEEVQKVKKLGTAQ